MNVDRMLGSLAVVALFTAPVVFLIDFVPAALTQSAPALPLDRILDLKSVMFALAIVVGGTTMVAVIAVAIRYSDRFQRRPAILHPNWNRGLFVGWIALVTGLVAVTILLSAGTMGAVEAPPPDPDREMTVSVTGVHPQWHYEVDHIPARMSGDLHVPADTVIQLEITSNDVLHVFAIHDMGVKRHAIPGETLSAWFVAEEPGEYQIVCTELCGEDHSRMTGTLVVMEPDAYDEWVEDRGGESPFAGGETDG